MSVGPAEIKPGKPAKPEKEVEVTVDGEDVATLKRTTGRALLLAAGLDPAKRQLIGINGRHQNPVANLDAELQVHERERFVTVSTAGTPVS